MGPIQAISYRIMNVETGEVEEVNCEYRAASTNPRDIVNTLFSEYKFDKLEAYWKDNESFPRLHEAI